ncbi:hypothetical protein EDD85DRAFT_500840 [Armillaria nabsnona]|nr:hypothetical protein EDD85DRAFT_500840 [Armillaria nabsnona]
MIERGRYRRSLIPSRSTLVLCSLATSDDSCLMGSPSISRPFARSLFQVSYDSTSLRFYISELFSPRERNERRRSLTSSSVFIFKQAPAGFGRFWALNIDGRLTSSSEKTNSVGYFSLRLSMLIMTATTILISYFAVVAIPYLAPMPRRSMNAPKFEGLHYDAFAGVVPRQRVLGRDLGKTFSTPIVTFESIDSIPPSDAHFLSLASTTPSISIAAQEFSQHLSSYDVSLISNGSSIDDSTDPSSSEMCSTGDILSRESIERIEKALDGDFYAFSKSFPRSVDTTLWRQLYGAMAHASLVPSQETTGAKERLHSFQYRI